MMKLERHTILHRKDETGVITESRVFGPDDEVPEGFGPQEFEVVKNEVRAATIEESVLTPWESPSGKDDSWAGEPQPDESEVNEGTPIQARSEEDQTEAEKEALAAVEEAAAEAEGSDDDENEVGDGTPVQAKIEAGAELTESEENPGEEKDGRKSGRRRSSGS